MIPAATIARILSILEELWAIVQLYESKGDSKPPDPQVIDLGKHEE
jgi:hypothetical protein